MMRRIQSCRFWSKSDNVLIFWLAFLFSASGCQPAPNVKTEIRTGQGFPGRFLTKPNSESATSGVTINAREPEKYSATLQLSIETKALTKAAGALSLGAR